MIPYGRQSIDEDDIAAVVAVLRSDWLTQGPAVVEFERAVADLVGAEHAVAFSSGTAGLHAASVVAGLGPGDVVGCPSLSFVATANCIRYVGARVCFIDVDPETLNLDLQQVSSRLDGLVVVHFAGNPFDMGALEARPRVVIEDAAHAIGAVGPDGPVGNCAHSDMCVFSFHPVKSIAAGEGGMVTTNSETLAEALRRFRHHGIRPGSASEPWAYTVDELGYNYRLSDLHAALGRSQLRRLPEFIDRRNDLADRYDSLLSGLRVHLPPAPSRNGLVHARHLYPVRVAARSDVFHDMRAGGIGVQVHYVPIHLQPRFASATAYLPQTEAVAGELLSLPLFPSLSETDQDRVVDALGWALDRCAP